MRSGRNSQKMDVFIEHSDIPKNCIHNWKEVRVVGKLTKWAEKRNISPAINVRAQSILRAVTASIRPWILLA